MFFLKGGSIAVNLAFVPLLISTLSPETYGVWLTITTFVAWLSFFDIGLGHGLRNKIAECIGDGRANEAKSYISTSYISLAVIVVVLVLLQLVIVPLFDWSKILNAPQVMQQELGILMIWVTTLVVTQFLLKLITSVMMALQMPFVSSLVILLGQLLAFLIISTWLLLRDNISLLEAGLVLSGAPVFVLFLSNIIIFSGPHRQLSPSIRCFDKKLIRPVFTLGSQFFFIQFTSLILFQSNNLIIAHTVGPEGVTEFGIAYKYIGLSNMLLSIIAVPFWSATTNAYSKGDYQWIRNSLNRLNKMWWIFVLLTVFLIIIGDFVYKIWLGDNSIKVDYLILGSLGLYFILFMRWTIYGNFLNGIGKIKLQFSISLLEILIHVPLALFLGSKLGMVGVLISMVLIGLINAIWPHFQLKRLLNGSATGLWAK